MKWSKALQAIGNARCTFCVLGLAMIVLPIAPAHAESDVGVPMGHLYVSRYPDRYQQYELADAYRESPFVPVNFYIVADIDFADVGMPEQNGINGIQTWEGQVRFPPGLLLLSAEVVGSNAVASDSDFVVDVGAVVLASSTPRVLVTLAALPMDVRPDTQIELLPSTNPLATGVIGWQEALDTNSCSNPETGAAVACYRPFEEVGNVVFYRPEPVSSTHTWTSVKQMYR